MVAPATGQVVHGLEAFHFLLELLLVPVDAEEDGEGARQLAGHESRDRQQEGVAVAVGEQRVLEGGLGTQLVPHFRFEGGDVDDHAHQDHQPWEAATNSCSGRVPR